MKKFCISFCLLLIILLIAVGMEFTPQKHTEYLRIHIRADSNLEKDQSVKYLVKDRVVEYLTPILTNCHTKDSAEKALESNLKNIESVANEVLKSNGFSYTSSAKIRQENFPTRTYNDLTLDSGFYDALIINLGTGTGDNWWCVVYPPLCFYGESKHYIYKSKLLEIINEFFKEK